MAAPWILSYGAGIVIVLASGVTAPVRANSRPSTAAPVVTVMEAKARMFPLNTEPVPKVAELLTCHTTLAAFAPPLKSTWRPTVVVRVEANDFFDLPHRGRIKECVANHQNQTSFFSNPDQFLALRRRRRHRLFNERVLACQQTGLGHGVMKPNRRRDDDRVKSGSVEQMAKILVALQLGIERVDMGQPLLVGVTHQLQAAILQLTKIPDEVWTPIATSHHAEVDWVIHINLRVRVC